MYTFSRHPQCKIFTSRSFLQLAIMVHTQYERKNAGECRSDVCMHTNEKLNAELSVGFLQRVGLGASLSLSSHLLLCSLFIFFSILA